MITFANFESQSGNAYRYYNRINNHSEHGKKCPTHKLLLLMNRVRCEDLEYLRFLFTDVIIFDTVNLQYGHEGSL